MNVCLGWAPALLQLDDNETYSCSLPNTSERPLLTAESVAAQLGHNDIEVRERQSPGYRFIVAEDFITYLYPTSGLHTYKDCHCAEETAVKDMCL